MVLKKLWVILLTVLVFLSAAALGVSAVYRVGPVKVNVSIVTEEAKTEAQELQSRLEKAYKKDSIFFADDEKAQELIKEYPYFRVTGFEKVYPNLLVFEVAEDAEVYAVEKVAGAEYYVLGEDGTVLDIRETHVNRLSGEENVLMKGLTVTAENGAKPMGDECFSSMLTLCREMSAALGGIRRNVASIEVFLRSPETIYRIIMREGVKIYVGNPSVQTEEKARRAVNEYLSLTNEQKLTGRLIVSDNAEGIFVSYSEKDEFQG